MIWLSWEEDRPVTLPRYARCELGLSAVCIDANAQLGGTCLRVGCIPSKAMLESSERYAETRGLLAEHGVNVEHVGLDLTKMLARKQKVVETLCAASLDSFANTVSMSCAAEES